MGTGFDYAALLEKSCQCRTIQGVNSPHISELKKGNPKLRSHCRPQRGCMK